MMPVFAPRSARPELPRDWIPVQRFEFRIDRAFVALRAHPVRPSPFPVGPFGSVSFRRRFRFLRRKHSSLRVVLLLEALTFPTASAYACGCTSPGVPFPYSARQPGAPVFPDGVAKPPALSVLRVSHPLDVFLRPRSCREPATPSRTSFLPAALLGFPRLPRLVPDPFGSGQGRWKPGVLSKALPDPATSAFSRALLSCASFFPLRDPFTGRDASVTGASESRSQDRRHYPQWRTAVAGLPEV